MSAINVNFIGRLGSDAEIVDRGDSKFISTRIAVNQRVRGTETTVWLTLALDYTDKFKNLMKWLKRGTPVHVHGTETVSLYTSKTGQTGIDRKVSVSQIDFIPFSSRRDDARKGEQNGEQTAPDEMTTGGLRPQSSPVDSESTMDDDLPF